MFKAFSNVLVVAAMLIAFAGQALAYTAIACETTEDAFQPQSNLVHSSMQQPNEFNHHEANTSCEPATELCCDTECLCPGNGCTSLTFLNSYAGAPHVLLTSEAVRFQPLAQPKSILTSLYRPPIFA